jgi:hypothetical protein
VVVVALHDVQLEGIPEVTMPVGSTVEFVNLSTISNIIRSLLMLSKYPSSFFIESSYWGVQVRITYPTDRIPITNMK